MAKGRKTKSKKINRKKSRGKSAPDSLTRTAAAPLHRRIA